MERTAEELETRRILEYMETEVFVQWINPYSSNLYEVKLFSHLHLAISIC